MTYPADLSFKAESKVVLIGTPECPQDAERLPPLPHVRANIAELKRLLLDPNVVGLPATSIVEIVDEPAASDVLGKLHKAAKLATDTLIVYYSGHGLYGDAQSALYLTSRNTESDTKSSAIDIEAVKRIIRESSAVKRVMILDCCYSGRAFDGGMSDQSDDLVSAVDLMGTYGIAAVPGDYKAWAPPGATLTFFSQTLINVLLRGIQNDKDTVTLDEVFSAVRDEIRRDARTKLPQRTNWIDGGKFRIARNRYADQDRLLSTSRAIEAAIGLERNAEKSPSLAIGSPVSRRDDIVPDKSASSATLQSADINQDDNKPAVPDTSKVPSFNRVGYWLVFLVAVGLLVAGFSHFSNTGNRTSGETVLDQGTSAPSGASAADSTPTASSGASIVSQAAPPASEGPIQQLETFALTHDAATRGDAKAQNKLGGLYFHGTGTAQSDRDAVTWYRKAAQQGNPDAQINLGFMYQEGRGVDQSSTEAIKWLQTAADQGDSTGMLNLGVMYKKGLGVTKSYDEAIKWFQKAADQGDPQGQVELGLMYENGLGTLKNGAEAVRWFQKAAEQGYLVAQLKLAWIYDYGLGVPKNETEAAKWYRKAADQGDEGAKEALQKLGH